jgi:hypothetical protein
MTPVKAIVHGFLCQQVTKGLDGYFHRSAARPQLGGFRQRLAVHSARFALHVRVRNAVHAFNELVDATEPSGIGQDMGRVGGSFRHNT